MTPNPRTTSTRAPMTVLVGSLAVLIAAALGGCRSSSSACSPCAPPPCAPAPSACAPCQWADPIYPNGCGGDQGLGRTGTGAFAR